jgi:hypothetical protein
MSQQVTENFVQQYGANVMHLSQQKGSRLQDKVRRESQKGKAQFFDRIGTVAAVLKTGRHSSTPQMDTPHSRRMVTINDYEWADLVDDQDKIRMLNDPTSEYAIAAAWAFGRSKDDVIIASALGSAYSGEAGATAVVHPDSQKLASCDGSGTAANLNVLALRRAKKLFDQNEVDESFKRYIACGASQIDSLLGQTEVTSSDYNTVKALVAGDVNTYMGFEFVRTERLGLTSSTAASFTTGAVGSGASITGTNRACIAWAQPGLLMSVGEDYVNKIDPRPDKSYAMQVYSRMSIGGTRMEEVKVMEIICKE